MCGTTIGPSRVVLRASGGTMQTKKNGPVNNFRFVE